MPQNRTRAVNVLRIYVAFHFDKSAEIRTAQHPVMAH